MCFPEFLNKIKPLIRQVETASTGYQLSILLNDINQRMKKSLDTKANKHTLLRHWDVFQYITHAPKEEIEHDIQELEKEYCFFKVLEKEVILKLSLEYQEPEVVEEEAAGEEIAVDEVVVVGGEVLTASAIKGEEIAAIEGGGNDVDAIGGGGEKWEGSPGEKQPYQGISAYGREAPMTMHSSSNNLSAPSLIARVMQQMQIPLSYDDAVIRINSGRISFIQQVSGATVTIQEARGVPREMIVAINGTTFSSPNGTTVDTAIHAGCRGTSHRDSYTS